MSEYIVSIIEAVWKCLGLKVYLLMSLNYQKMGHRVGTCSLYKRPASDSPHEHGPSGL